MDLIDLFICSEGTLCIITEVTFNVMTRVPATCVAFVPGASEASAFDLAANLRRAAKETWRTRDPRGLDVSAIEYMDRRSIEIVVEDGQDRLNGIMLPPGTTVALIVQLELLPDTSAEQAYTEIGAALGSYAADTPLTRFIRLLEVYGMTDGVAIAVPGDWTRAGQIFAFREAVPVGVNHRVGQAKRTVDSRIEKTAADMIVPFPAIPEMSAVYLEGFTRRGLDYAIWGHISDGNLHPNVLPRSAADVIAGREAILEFGRAASRLGGCPLAEHGVGRNTVKQALLRGLYGEAGIEEMRRIKRALDPEWKLAPGVLFPERAMTGGR